MAGAQEQGSRGLACAGHSRVPAVERSECAVRVLFTGIQALSLIVAVFVVESHRPGSNGRAPRHWS